MARETVARAGRWTARLLPVLAVALASCEAPTLPREQRAYDYTQLTGGLVYRWEPGRTIAVFVDPVAMPEAYDAVGATRRAAARWNEGTDFDDFRLVVTDDVRAADVIVRHFQAPRRVDVFDCEPPGGGAGRTIFCPDPVVPILPLLDGGGGRVKVEVVIDVERVQNLILELAGQTREEYFGTLVTHELGHVVGIGGHSNEVGDIMRSVPQVTAPSADDLRTLRVMLRDAPDLRL